MIEITRINPSENTRIRLEAAQIYGKRRVTVENALRELERQSIASAMKSGAARWEAFRDTDELIAAIRDRLEVLAALDKGIRATVLPLAAAGGRA